MPVTRGAADVASATNVHASADPGNHSQPAISRASSAGTRTLRRKLSTIFHRSTADRSLGIVPAPA